jgi:ERCC4-type nuclease
LTEIKIVADYREKASGVPFRLESLGVHLVYRNLSVGDYVLSDIYAVERKKTHDFFSSLFSGRLFNQAQRLAEAYQEPIFVVEGDFHVALESFPNPRALWGALASLSLRFGGHLFFTAEEDQTAELLYVITRQLTAPSSREPVVRERRKISSLGEAQLAVASSLPRIGIKLADRMLRRFGTVRRLFQASSLELSSVEGFGRKRAERVATVLDSPYKPPPFKAARQRLLEEEQEAVEES